MYCGRHDCGIRVLTGNLAAVMKTMGQGDVRTTMNYQHPELQIVLRSALIHKSRRSRRGASATITNKSEQPFISGLSI